MTSGAKNVDFRSKLIEKRYRDMVFIFLLCLCFLSEFFLNYFSYHIFETIMIAFEKNRYFLKIYIW